MRVIVRFVWCLSSILLGMAALGATAAQVTINPGDDIQTVVNANPAGTTFNIKAGLYREQSVTPKDWDVFTGEPGAIMNGSILLTNFVQQGSVWVATASVPQGQTGVGSFETGWEGSTDPDDLFYNDVAFHHVLTQGEVVAGKWYVDYGQGKIYVADDPAGKKVEISVTRSAFSGSATNVTIQGLIIEKYAIPAQFGAIGDQYPGANWLVQGNEARLNHGTGITGANGWKVLGNYSHHNGGFGITCAWWALDRPVTGLLVEGNEMSFNNTLHYDPWWGCGGAKFCTVDGMICRNNYSHDNRGDGLWDDVYSINVTYEGNMVISNFAMGISHEIGYAATIRNNYSSGNGAQQAGWVCDAQLLVQNSQNVDVYSNTVVVAAGFGNGITIVNQDRGSGPYGPCIAQNNYIHHNNIMYTSTQGHTGAACDNDSFWTTCTNRFDYDNYTGTDTSAVYLAWNDNWRDFATFQSYGQELHGTLNAPTATRVIGLGGNLNFGAVATGATATATLAISNSGNTAFVVTSINYPSGFSATPRWGIVPAGGSLNVTVTFAPTANTNYGGTITVMTDATNGANTVTVSGSGSNVISGVVVNPGDSIQAAVNANPTGTTFIIKAGLYRMQSVTPKDWDVFIGEPGAILSGAMLLTNFVWQGSNWVATAAVSLGQVHGEVETGWDGSREPSDLFFNDVALHHVLTQGEVATGKWYIDYNLGKIYVADDPTGKTVEIGVTRCAFSGPATNVTVQGFVVEKYAIPAQMGAIGDQYPAAGWVIRNNEVKLNHGCGITCGDGGSIIGNNVHHNGQKGVGSGANRILVEGNEMAWNNTLHFNMGWEAGGLKCAVGSNLVFRGNYSHDNYGDGLWTDINCINVMYEGNLLVNNFAHGISHEISYTATIRNNYASGNGPNPVWLWNAQILVQNSQDVDVYSNTVVVVDTNGNGIAIIDQNRGDGAYGPWLARNNRVHHNNITHTTTHGASGIVCDYDNANFWATCTNSFDYNNYTVANSGGYYWSWDDTGYTFAQFQSHGHELHGTLNAPVATRIINLSGNLAFGSVATGTTATATMTIANSGNTAFMVTGINYPVGFSGPWWGIVPAGGSTNVTVTFSPTAATNYGGTITVMTDATNGTHTINVSGGTVTAPGQSPFGGSARALPGQIEAENYDNGGEGVAYHDSDTTNNGDATLRNDGVDIKNAGGSNYVIGWNAAGEWREYTVDISNGAYRISSRVATVNTNAQQRVLLGDGPEGSNFVVLGTMDVPNTGAYDTFQDGVLDGVVVTNGGHGKVLRLETLGNFFDVDWTRFDPIPGSVSGSGAAGGAATVDLSAEGTEDWAHWGFSGTGIDHKSAYGSAVNHIMEAHVGSPLQYLDNINGYSWTDGMPTVNAVATRSGIYIVGTGNSFTITVPADTTSRTVKVYVGGWMSAGTLTAHLSDNSTADYTDSSFSNNGASYYAVYTITYKASAANQNLTVRWQMASGAAGGNVTLQAVTLRAGGGNAEVVRFVRAGMSSGSTGCSFSWSGASGATNDFNVYRCTNLVVGIWLLAAPGIARSGTGTNVWTDTNVFPQAFYRVTVPN